MKKKIIAVVIIAFAALAYAAPPMIESGGFLFFPKVVLTAQGTGGTVGMCTDGSACNYGLYSADTTHVALRAGAADYLSVGSSANGNVTGSLVISAGATAASITCTSPGAANAIVATAGAFQNTSGVGTAGQCLLSGGASASTTWGNCDNATNPASATFGGDVNATAYPVNTAWAAFIPFASGTTRKICWVTETAGVGAGTILGTLFNVTGAANVCTVTITCNSATGVVVCTDCAGSLTSTSTYDMRWTTDGCTTRPAGELTLTYTTP